MNFVEIENISINHKNEINDIKTNIKYDVHEKFNNKLINMFKVKINNVFNKNSFQFC